MVNLDPETLGHCELKGKLLCYTYVIQQNFSPQGSQEIESGRDSCLKTKPSDTPPLTSFIQSASSNSHNLQVVTQQPFLL